MEDQFKAIVINQIENNFSREVKSLDKSFLKEGNVLLFNVDVSRDNDNLRLIIRKIEDLEKIFLSQRYKINLFLSNFQDFELLNDLLFPSKNNNLLFVFVENNEKLLSFNFSNHYKVSNFSQLDILNKAQKINYSFEIQ